MNLLCGCIGIYYALTVNGYGLTVASVCIGLAAIFDFFDGFAARLLKVHSDLGKQLDSLADLVTFGVLPGFIVFEMLTQALHLHPIGFSHAYYLAFLIPIFSAYRLAKFNIDTRQNEQFIGVPTPANSLLIGSFPLILREYYPLVNTSAPAKETTAPEWINFTLLNPWFFIGITLIMSYLLVAELPLLALKFKNFGWKGNKMRYLLIGGAGLGLLFFKVLALPFIVFFYILLSVFDNQQKKRV